MSKKSAPIPGYLDMTNSLHEAGLVAPIIPYKLRGGVEGSNWHWTINCDFGPMAAYMLNAPHLGGDGSDPGPDMLDRYLEPKWDYWMLAHAGHGLNSFGLGILAKFRNFFFSQQVGYGGVYMEHPQFNVNRTHTAYNIHIAPFHEGATEGETTMPLMLLHSDYRGYSFVASPLLTLCHNADPQDNPLVPDGWGIIYDALADDPRNPETHLMLEAARNFDPRIAASIDYLDAVVARH